MREQIVDELCRALRPKIGSHKSDLLRKWFYSKSDPKERAEAQLTIEKLFAFHAKTTIDKAILLPPPSKEECHGDINIGVTTYLGKDYYEFGLNLRDINRHAGLFGSTRSGKTTLATNLIRSIHAKGIKVLVLDWEKNYRGIADEYPDFGVFTVGPGVAPFYHNPLSLPPGIPAEEFSKSLIAIISHDYLGGYGSDTIMLQKLVSVYHTKGTPTFSDLYKIIEEEITEVRKTSDRSGGRRGLWKETVERIPEWLSVGYTSDVLFSQYHLPIDKLIFMNAVLELGNIINRADRAFICHLVINQYFFFVRHAGIVHEHLKSVIVAEEAHHLFGIDAQRRDGGLSLIGDLYREVGKYGVGLIAIDQTPSMIPNEVFANMNTKVAFVQNTKDDTLAMARAMNLEDDAFDYLGRLNTGEAIVSVKQRIHDAFTIRTYFKEPLRNIPDEDLSGMMNKFSGLNSTISDAGAVLTGSNGYRIKESISPKEKLSVHEKALLRDIIKYPFDGVDFRTKRLSWHQTDMTAAHSSLSLKGLVDPVNVSGKKLFGLTVAGREAAVQAGIDVPRIPVRGGVAHGYGVNVAKMHLTKLGFTPVTEHENIDLVDPGAGIAVEVETGKSDIFSNLKKLVSAKYLYRYMLGVDKAAETAIRQIVKPESGVSVMTTREFSKLTKEDILSGPSQTRLS